MDGLDAVSAARPAAPSSDDCGDHDMLAPIVKTSAKKAHTARNHSASRGRSRSLWHLVHSLRGCGSYVALDINTNGEKDEDMVDDCLW